MVKTGGGIFVISRRRLYRVGHYVPLLMLATVMRVRRRWRLVGPAYDSNKGKNTANETQSKMTQDTASNQRSPGGNPDGPI